MLCEGLQWPDAIYGAGSNPRSRAMRRIIAALVAGLIASGTVVACDDHHGECTIEDWRWNAVSGAGFIMIDGVTTCDKGVAALRLYEGEGGR